MKSILLIGQSNMAGRGFLDSVKPIIDERIFMLRNGRWQMMEEPIHSDRSVAGIGPAASFAKRWLDDHPDETIGLIPCADGGTSIEEWSDKSMLTRHALSEARFAMETSELIGVLWHQGENDSQNNKYQTYETKLSHLIQFFRTELELPKLPFVIGLLGTFLGKEGFGASATEYQEINKIIKNVAQKEHHCYFVTAEGLTANPDGIHIDGFSQRLFGIRYYEAFSSAKNVENRLENENEIEKDLYKSEFTKNEQIYMLVARLSKNKITYQDFINEMSQLNS
ncbi:sialate O-acetylesterase [Staphylococcus cohnii]|uniref:Acetylxylan esterase n=1 Tax=Staphylococcus cohnii TaxID=29382 RepID=A0A2T4LTU8_9STAP|nr:sialate O-acetylesterase [Staphylococcus cohnii]PTF07961.1 acetylxylan esterase [Staphylococcus cohnii]PTF66751.1 acetylxylan esterase [Staphylococcus cohnii]PTG67739.1 acetylxylan esterase [Staphylococcus cohnii]